MWGSQDIYIYIYRICRYITFCYDHYISDEPYCRDLFIPRSIHPSKKKRPYIIYIYTYIYIHIGNGFIHQYIVKNSFVQDIFNQPEICMFSKIYMAKMFQTLYQISRTFLFHPNFKMYLYFVFVL